MSVTRASGLSVHYPFAIVEFLGCDKLDEADAGELLLRFRDEDGCSVTLRVKLEVLAGLRDGIATAA